jgi:hypothetical protein
LGDTYDARVQLGASRRRKEDAIALHEKHRWNGAIYMGGYAIECCLKSLICFEENKTNFKETIAFKKGLQGSDLHNLAKLLESAERLQRAIKLDRRQPGYREAWHTVSSLWLNDELRYSDKAGNQQNSEKFIEAVKQIHQLLLTQQEES